MNKVSIHFCLFKGF